MPGTILRDHSAGGDVNHEEATIPGDRNPDHDPPKEPQSMKRTIRSFAALLTLLAATLVLTPTSAQAAYGPAQCEMLATLTRLAEYNALKWEQTSLVAKQQGHYTLAAGAYLRAQEWWKLATQRRALYEVNC
jgi:hypothetical protein